MSLTRLIWLFVGTILILCPLSLKGTMVLPLDLSQMTDQAGKVFVGRCLGIEEELDENKIPSTFVRFEVLNGLKGTSTGETVLIKQFGVQREPLHVKEGEKAVVPVKTMALLSRGYRSGGEYLLFLYPESVLGFTSPVGAGQGRFEVKSGPEGLRVAVPPLEEISRGIHQKEMGVEDLDRLIRTVESLVNRE